MAADNREQILRELEQTKSIWQERLSFLQTEQAITASSIQKFELLKRIEECQEELKKINAQLEYIKKDISQPTIQEENKPTQSSNIIIPKMHILHLSDLHFGNLEQAQLWSNQLAEDLRNELSISSLDALILSGDIANKSTPEEYESAQIFLKNFCQDFPLKSEQIIIVPGNHDVNRRITDWDKTKTAKELENLAYKQKLRKHCNSNELQLGLYIEESSNTVWVRDNQKYQERFTNFSNFYESIKSQSYPLEYEQQATIDYFPNKKLLILGLNSAWQLDHKYTDRASINMNAISNALSEIRRNSEYDNCLKIAVWHHPLNSTENDRIKDHGFMEQLAKADFRLFLHGHIHKAKTDLYRYDMSQNGRKMDCICAGTFGAPTRELVLGYPWQYNLLKFEENQVTVETRRREEENGTWKADARWTQGKGKDPLPRYFIQLINDPK